MKPITGRDISDGVNMVKCLVKQVTDAAAPYKQIATFIKVSCGIVTCETGGEVVKIGANFIYASAGQLTDGETFYLDNRYIQTK
jgi:hypothetical protein